MSKSLIIECLIHREGGSIVELPILSGGSMQYHFKPNVAGAHVAAIADKDHIRCLLAIDAYQVYDGEADADAPAPVASPQPASDVLPPPAPADADGADFDAEDDEDPEALMDDEDLGPMVLVDEGDEQPVDLSQLEESALREVFHQRLGRRAHPTMSKENMIAKIEEAEAAA